MRHRPIVIIKFLIVALTITGCSSEKLAEENTIEAVPIFIPTAIAESAETIETIPSPLPSIETAPPSPTKPPLPTMTPTRVPTPTKKPTPSLAESGQIVFQSKRDQNWEIYIMNADGSIQTNLTNNTAADEEPVWSPDGTRIVFVSERDGNQEIYIMDADGTNVQNLSNHPANDKGPRISPDGTQIAFASKRDGNMRSPSHIMNIDGSNVVELDRAPSWFHFGMDSPNGMRHLIKCFGDDSTDICLGDINITNSAASERVGLNPWSPDSSLIVYESRETSTSFGDLYVMNADGTGVVQLTDTPAWDMEASWSPVLP